MEQDKAYEESLEADKRKVSIVECQLAMPCYWFPTLQFIYVTIH